MCLSTCGSASKYIKFICRTLDQRAGEKFDITECRRGPFYASQKHLLLPKHELKSMEDYAVFNLCECNITSAPTERLKW